MSPFKSRNFILDFRSRGKNRMGKYIFVICSKETCMVTLLVLFRTDLCMPSCFIAIFHGMNFGYFVHFFLDFFPASMSFDETR